MLIPALPTGGGDAGDLLAEPLMGDQYLKIVPGDYVQIPAVDKYG